MASNGAELRRFVRSATTVLRSYVFGTKVLSIFDSIQCIPTRLTLLAFHSYDGKLSRAGVAQW
jgi:hypothetical protein